MEIFPYHRSSGHLDSPSSVVTKVVYEWENAEVCHFHIWGPVSSIYGVFSIDVRVGGASSQILRENSTRPTSSASNIFLTSPSMVCLFVSMITISLSPSFLHFPHCAVKSLRKSYVGPILVFFFWQYLLNCWYCVCRLVGFLPHVFYATTTLNLCDGFAQKPYEQYLPNVQRYWSSCSAY